MIDDAPASPSRPSAKGRAGVAQHFDRAVGPVADVDLDRRVGTLLDRIGARIVLSDASSPVGAAISLYHAEQRRRIIRAGCFRRDVRLDAALRQGDVKLPGFLAP